MTYSEPAAETGWLIEADGECIGIVGGEIAWVPYTFDDALRFARYGDARNMLEYLRTSQVTSIPQSVFIAEHAWV